MQIKEGRDKNLKVLILKTRTEILQKQNVTVYVNSILQLGVSHMNRLLSFPETNLFWYTDQAS